MSTEETKNKCTIFLPFEIGEAVKVDTRTVPTGKIDLSEDEIPNFFDARIVSIRKNIKGVYFKVAIRAPWLCQMHYEDTGPEETGVSMERYFTYPLSAIGKTVFLESRG